MRSFINCEKGYNKQLASAYIVFMIAGSYFHKCHCQSRSPRFFLHYAEMPRQKQFEYEQRVIKKIECLDKTFLEKLSQLQCEVVGWQEEGDFVMVFQTYGFEELEFIINQNGNFQLLNLNMSELKKYLEEKRNIHHDVDKNVQ